ncbi:MAG: CPBP family intramembrane glutamic endopeptidase [Promethearchaeota archaeon]
MTKKRIHDESLFTDEPVATKESFWRRPDRLDVITYFMIVLYFIAIFQNITLLSSPIAADQKIALQAMAIALLGVGGIALKTLFDVSKVSSSENQESKDLMDLETLTTTIYENPFSKNGLKGLMNTGIFFAIAFILQVVLTNLVFSFPLSELGFIQGSDFIFAVISSTSEELFFTLGLTAALSSHFKWLSIPILGGVFTYYHAVVYQNVNALIFVLVMRLVYTTLYLVSRRVSVPLLAHFFNNLIVAIRI